jgi:chromate transport protein ChrA
LDLLLGGMVTSEGSKVDADVTISLPGALGMFGLSIGVSNIDESLPPAVYAVLSGLNAATVGIIALAAVELSDKAVTDHLTRILVFLAATAGMLYNALWYFPVLMFAAGCSTVIYDYRWFHRPIRAIFKLTRKITTFNFSGVGGTGRDQSDPAHEFNNFGEAFDDHNRYSAQDSEPRTIPPGRRLNFSWKSGAAIIATFSLTFVIIMVLRRILPQTPLLYKLFANLYLAGTIIFGGGPVVIPLLREYIVAEGWVSPRDFLIGLAVIQACPGPNFNFAVFLGSLTAIHGGYPAVTGAILGFCGIFAPGIILVHGTMGMWGGLRSRRWVKSAVRGINAGAVGLIYTAVYRIWQIGYIDEGYQSGKSLGNDPWWVVVAATSYVGGRYFGIAAPLAILLGAVLGLIRYGAI